MQTLSDQLVDNIEAFVAGVSRAGINTDPAAQGDAEERLVVWGLVRSERDGEILLEDSDGVRDTLLMARDMFQGKANSLDALCRRLEVDNSGRTYHGAIQEFTSYPADTEAGALDCLLDFPGTLVVSTTFGYRTKSQGFKDMDLKQRQMVQSGDKAARQIADLDDAQSELSDDAWVRGTHHLSIAVYADTLEGLDTLCPKLRERMLDTGAVVGASLIEFTSRLALVMLRLKATSKPASASLSRVRRKETGITSFRNTPDR